MLNPISSKKLVLVTGVSGAGHSTALKILEDYGFTAVDNLPLALVDPLIALEVETGGRSIAIGLDARTSGFGADAVARLVKNLAKRLGDGFKMVFISAGHADLMRRYNATRRQHPLGHDYDLDAAVRAAAHLRVSRIPFVGMPTGVVQGLRRAARSPYRGAVDPRAFAAGLRPDAGARRAGRG